MNYRKVYMAIIAKAIKENRKKLSKDAENYVYYEAHHILPKSLFPAWKKRKSNIVLLTAREHFFVHQLLAKIYPHSNMIFALMRLSCDGQHTSSRVYGSERIAYSKRNSELQKQKYDAENLTAAESRVRDTEMAEEMVNYTKNAILSQATLAMQAQSNSNSQNVLALLR